MVVVVAVMMAPSTVIAMSAMVAVTAMMSMMAVACLGSGWQEGDTGCEGSNCE